MTIQRLKILSLHQFGIRVNCPLLQLAFAPVKMFPKFLLDDQYSQHKDGVREVVKMIKKAGEALGLRRKVEEEENVEKPRFTDRAINTLAAATFGKHAEF